MPGLPARVRHLRIFPSRLAIDRRVRAEAGTAVAADAYVTFQMLTDALGSLEGSRYASPLVGRLTLRSLMAGAGGWLAKGADDPHAVRAVQRAVTEIRLAGITAKHLEMASLSDELSPIVKLLGRYEGALAEAGLADDADREREAVHAVTQGRMPARLAAVERVTVEGGASLFGARLDLLSVMAASGIAVEIRLAWDDARSELFAWPEASLHGIESRGHANLVVTFDDRVGDGPLSEARAAQSAKPVAEDAPVRVLHVASRAEHGRRIAAEVGAWLHAGVPPDEICVGVGDLDDLGPQIVAQLEAAQIPAYLRRGPRVLSTPAGRALEHALRLPGLGFPRERLLELWLTLGRQLELPTGSWPPERVAAAVRRAGVRSARLLSYRDALDARAERDGLRHDGEAARQSAMAVADGLDELMEALRNIPARAPLGEQVEALERLVEKLEFESPRLHASADDPDGARHQRRALLRAQAARHAGLESVRDIFLELRQALRAVPPGPQWTRDEVASFVELLLGEHTLAPPGMRCGSVAVVDLSELVETRFRCVLLAGIDQDVFPRSPPVDLVLTGDVRAEINRLLGPRLLQYGPMTGRGALRGDARDTWVWMEALAACGEQLVVTYTTPEGEESGRSELVDEMLRSLDANEPLHASPSYTGEIAASPDPIMQHWSLEALGSGARITGTSEAGRAAALGTALKAFDRERVREISRRVANESAIRSPDRRAAPLAPGDEAQLQRRFFDSVHTTSQLDTLGLCSFRYFAGTLLGLSVDEVPTLGADAREEGSAAHAALHLIYDELRLRGGLVDARRKPDETLQLARDLFDDRADDILAEVTVHPALRTAVLEEAWFRVLTQLEHDLADDSGYDPVALEHSFSDRGQAPAPALLVDDPGAARCLRVRGSIDRVDRAGASLLTLDYKRTYRKRTEHRHFQLPLYALVALRDFGEAAELGAAWVELRTGKRRYAGDVSSDPAVFERELQEALWPRVDRVVGGDISPDPDAPETCRFCDFGRLCRFEANRAIAPESEEEGEA